MKLPSGMTRREAIKWGAKLATIGVLIPSAKGESSPALLSSARRRNAGPVPNLAWWKLNENTGTSTADSTGNGNTGTLTGGASWVSGPNSSSAVSFSGAQQVSVSSSAAYSGSGFISVCAWLKPNVTSRGDIVTRWTTGLGGSQFTLLYGLTVGKPQFYISNGTLPTIIGSGEGSTTMSIGVWYHVAGVYDGSNVKVFLNGVFQSQAAATAMQTTSLTGYIIGNNAAPDGQLDGAVDDARVYGYALTNAEVLSIYNAGAK